LDKKRRVVDRFLIYIEKYKFAILGTLLVHILIIVGSSFKQVQHVMRMPPQEVSVEMPLEDIEFEPEIEEILDLKKEPLPSQEITNVAADANDTREKSYENYSTNKDEIEEDVLQNAKDLERQFFEEAAANNPNAAQSQINSHVPIESITKKDVKKDQQSSVKSGGNKAFAGEVMISFNLKGRKAFSLPNPGYTCNNTGTIVIEIKVGGDGYVKSTNFLSNLSTGATDCLVERATKYASMARFNLVSSGTQTGTITYKFISQ
jgi:hypothetical protein